jgi:FkbM family methyltransferase
MFNFLTNSRISEFEDILMKIFRTGIPLTSFLDGGAHLGGTSIRMVNRGGSGSKCFSFEPYPPNIERFKYKDDPRIQLIPYALGSNTGMSRFFAHHNATASTTQDKSDKLPVGSSVVGRLLTDDESSPSNYVDVRVVRADDVISDNEKIEFVKLDLQGGEYDALLGMPRIISTAYLVYVEFCQHRESILSLMDEAGYRPADTQYFFTGKLSDYNEEFIDYFEDPMQARATTGLEYISAWRRHDWDNYSSTFNICKSKFNKFMTNILFVRKAYEQRLADAFGISQLY